MSMHCPECGSDDVYRVAVTYEKGVQNTRSKTIFGGGLLSLFGPVFGLGVAVTRGRNTTLEAERLAPPQRAHPILVAFLLFLAALFFGDPLALLIIYSAQWAGLGKPVGVIVGAGVFWGLLFGLPAYVLYKGFRHNHRFPKMLAEWNNLYTCARCGNVFPKEKGSLPLGEYTAHAPEN